MSELVEEAQADTVVKFGPRKPYLMEMWPEAMSAIIFGMKKGLNRGVPSPLAKLLTSSRKVFNPPIPEPQMTPTRSVLMEASDRLASLWASSTATRAYCA